jgi:HEPN domain-containing protein
MNRADFQKISLKKIAEAKTLLKEKAYSGAYYLAGLSIECAFKARLAKAIQKYEFPDKKFVNEIYIHD